MSGVPFICQRCKQPIRIHESLSDISPAALDLLTGSNSSTASKRTPTPTRPAQYPAERREVYEKTVKQDSTPIVKRVIPSVKNGSASPSTPKSTESFVVLTQSQINKSPKNSVTQSGSPNARSGNAVSERNKIPAKLFDAISGRSDIDYPICDECGPILLEIMEAKRTEVKKERDSYLEFVKGLQNEGKVTPEEKGAAEKELAEIRKQEAATMEELKKKELELSTLQAELARLEAESNALNAEETAFWRSRNAFSLSLEEFQNERDEVNIKFDHDAKLLERLQRTNVFNDVFRITYDDVFGIINGLRLGRSKETPVPWNEINAAWGQTVLMFAIIAEKVNFEFDGYKLHPMGSISKIEEIQKDPTRPSSAPTKSKMLDLFYSPNGSVFSKKSQFDAGLVAFLECVRQIGEFAEAHDASLRLPYKINKDKIGDAVIRYAFNDDAQWTKALKYVLTNGKWILSYASNLPPRSGER